eukprot:gene2598-3140_t
MNVEEAKGHYGKIVAVAQVGAILGSTLANDPVKEILYIPTSEAIRFRAKVWIDVFGARLAKGSASLLTAFAHGNDHKLKEIMMLPAIALTLCYFLVAWRVGVEFSALMQDGGVVGAEAGKDKWEWAGPGTRLPDPNGLYPGDVGYGDYDPDLFEGVSMTECDPVLVEEDGEISRRDTDTWTETAT